MATQSSVLALEIPWTEKPGGLQSMWLQRDSYLTLGVRLQILGFLRQNLCYVILTYFLLLLRANTYYFETS